MTSPFLPQDDALRKTLHNEVHARPSARVRLPALIVYVAVLNNRVSKEQELEHLQKLLGQQNLQLEDLQNNFLRLRLPGHTLKWERHTEFTRYSIVQPLPESACLGLQNPDLFQHWLIDPQWLQHIPGTTVAAIQLCMMHADLEEPSLLTRVQHWWGDTVLVGSLMGHRQNSNPHSLAVASFRIRSDGFERLMVLAPLGTTEARAGRISRRLLELETYRLMALRGLPVTKQISPMLTECEAALADITARMENKSDSDQSLLDSLVSLAARVERSTAEHGYRFSATRAYDTLVTQRIAELRERPIPDIQTIGDFMQLRLSPAMATVAACAQRLTSLSERVARASALLRTRVDIATEIQNQQLLAKLTRGQELQLRLQSTVEGLSIAAISYYVISLLLYAAKALKAGGLHIEPEMAVGWLIPPVIWLVWRINQKIHQSFDLDEHKI